MRVKIGFWNVLGRLPSMAQKVSALIDEQELDVMCFAETGASHEQIQLFCKELSRLRSEEWTQPHPAVFVSKRTELITRLPRQFISLKTVDTYFSTVVIDGPNVELLLQVVHFPSLLNRDKADVNVSAKAQAKKIRNEFAESGKDGYIVLGDFNLNPFDDAMMSADGFNSTNDRSIAAKKQRKIDDVEYAYTYNPCWSLLSETPSSVPGSYYLKSPGASTQHWQTLDQVIFCPTATKSFIDGSLQRIVEIDKSALLRIDKTGVKRIDESTSDHLPIAFGIEI